MTEQVDRLRSSTLAAFSAPCLPIAALGLPLTVYLPAYYARELGLPLAAVGLAFVAVRVLDALVDPLVGLAIDRTHTRLGRFKPWLIGAAAMLCLGAWMLFMARPGVSIGHLWLWLPVAFLGFSIANLTQQAWASALSPGYGERARIYGWWQAAIIAGLILVLAAPSLIRPWSGAGPGLEMRTMGWVVVLLMPPAVALAVWRVGAGAGGPTGARARLADYLGMLRLGTVRRLMATDLLLSTAAGVAGSLAVFYYGQVKAITPAQINTLLLIFFAAAFVGAPLWPLLARRIGKHRALAVNCASMVVGFVAVLAAPFTSLAAAGAAMILMGLPYSGGAALMRAMLADCGDEFRLAAGVDPRGMLYVLLTETTKLGYALGAGVLVLLPHLGFDARAAHNGPGALLALTLLFAGLPSLLALLAGGLILGHRLDAARHAEIRAALADR